MNKVLDMGRVSEETKGFLGSQESGGENTR
jgi:hypothetical protein